MTLTMHKIHFRPGLRPDPDGGAYNAPSDPLVGWSPDLGNYARWGPRDNGFPGPAVAVDGPGVMQFPWDSWIVELNSEDFSCKYSVAQKKEATKFCQLQTDRQTDNLPWQYRASHGKNVKCF